MKTTKTYAEWKRFVGLASAYLSTQPTENALAYALRRTMRRIESAVKPIEEEIGDKKIELASLDERKNLCFDARGNYQFSRENYQAFTKYMREIDAGTLEVEVFVCNPAKVPEDIQPIFREEFEGCGVLAGNRETFNIQHSTPNIQVTVAALEKEAHLLCLAIEEMPPSEQQTRLSLEGAKLATNLRLLLGAVTAEQAKV